MNIEQFYDADERRRDSAEFEFGTGWTDADGHLYELSWIEATGELYLMSEGKAFVSEDLFIGFTWSVDQPINAIAVNVIATIATHDAVDTALLGWQEAETQEYSLQWLIDRFPQADSAGE